MKNKNMEILKSLNLPILPITLQHIANFKRLQKLHSDKKITTEDLKLLVKSSVVYMHNDIISFFNINHRNLPNDYIFEKNRIENFIDREYKNQWGISDILKKDFSGVCEAGYIISDEKMSLTDDEYKRLDQLIFEIL